MSMGGMGRPGYQQTPALPGQRTDLERSRIMTPPDEPALRETRIGAYGICICDDRILVVRKAKGPYKGLYDLPGGGVEFGESPTETVAREFLEEAGVAVEVKELVGSFSLVSVFPADSGTHLVELHHLGFLYRVNLAAPAPIKEDPDGRDSLGSVWLPLRDASPDKLSPLAREGLQCISSQGSGISLRRRAQ
ncbi:MAG: NUDIX hydrolase [Symbiobacterium thermophilum]|nr:NUDIX hydrolase [Symbiobacterium thermophilum]